MSKAFKSQPTDLVGRKAIRGIDMDTLLFDLLEKGLPHGNERDFKDILPKGGTIDTANNFIYTIGEESKYKTMFSSHLDTVHPNPSVVVPYITKDSWVYGKTLGNTPSILGADDKTGVWLMLKMMEYGVPGLYVFHAGEERGGVGSQYIVNNNTPLLEGIDRCIALDRKDYNSVITKQGGMECCSDTFAKSLADQLNVYMPALIEYSTDPTGTFTDSANYTAHIPECTNLSVGYLYQHSTKERFDLIFLQTMLLPALVNIEWEKLPTMRKPVPKYTHRIAQYMGGRREGIELSPKPLSITDTSNITHATPWNTLPAWTPSTPIPADIDNWRVGILLQRYIQTNGIVNATIGIIKELKNKNNSEELGKLQKQVDGQKGQIKKLLEKIEEYDELLDKLGVEECTLSEQVTEEEGLKYLDSLDRIQDILHETFIIDNTVSPSEDDEDVD